MEDISNFLTTIDVNNLLKIFDIQISIGVLLVFFICRTLFSKLIIKTYYILTKNKKNAKDSVMFKPLKIFFILLGIYIAINIFPTSKQILYIMNKLFKIVAIYYVIKAISTLISEDSVILQKLFDASDNIAVNAFFCRIARFILWIIFIFIVINELGYNLSGLAAGLGIGSAALALAAQDLVKSLISGAIILTDKPFIIGDWIELGAYQGTVIDITFRSTRIKSYNNSVITIPNSTITTEYVTNWNRISSRRFDCTLNLSLNTTAEEIKTIVKKFKVVLENNPEIIKDTVQVSLNEISTCSSDIKIFLFVRRTDYGEFLKAKQDILCSLLEVVEKENVDLAYPTQTVYLKRTEEIES